MIDTAAVRAYFDKLGLKKEMADIYLALHKHGTQTMSELARNANINRISVYRLLDELKATGLIEIEPHYKRNLIRPAPITNVQLLIDQKEQELKDLQRGFSALARQLSASQISSTTTQVKFYEGIEGLRQMVWNQVRGKSENLSILYDSMQHMHEKNFSFFERWVQTCNDRNLRFRGIIGEHFVASQQKWYASHRNERLKHWNPRFISEKDFPIPYSMVTYDDVVLYYNWSDANISGIEIHNQHIATMQRQFFEMLWQRAKPVDDLVGPKSLGVAQTK